MRDVRRMSRRQFFLVLLLPLAFLAGCSRTDYSWGWYVVWPSTDQGRTNLEFLIDGYLETITLSVTAMSLSIAVGFLVSLPGLSSSRYARSCNRVYVETFRSIPMLVALLWVYYGLPVVLAVELGVFAAGVLALAICDSAFEAEIFRGGIQSIEKGQFEASSSLGLSYWHTMRYVVLPQAIRRILPPLGNQFVYMLKMSSLVSVIGLTDLTRQANELTVTLYRPLEIYTVLVLEYLVLILIVSWLVRKLETRLGADVRAGAAASG